MKIHSRWRKAAVAICLAPFLGIAGCAAINSFILRETRGRIFTDAAATPENDVALVLGTSPTLHAGKWTNPFFEGRIDAAAALFRAGKVRHFLVSGDNSRKEYDEPTAMRAALMQRGIPENAITLDYAGFRTLDSVARARSVFGQSRLTIVSDDFHVPRALFLARHRGIDAIGFASPAVRQEWSRKTRLREIAARVAAWLDVFVLRTEPKFEGPPVAIRITHA